jgi:hypothetical protein
VKQIGSQMRETLAESGYKLVGRPAQRMVVLQDKDGKREVWYANDHFAGYTVQVGRWGYEFGYSVIVEEV